MERVVDSVPHKNLHFYDVYFIKLVLDSILLFLDKILLIDDIDQYYVDKLMMVRYLVSSLSDDFENYFNNPF